jgi:hypothetical protein
MVFIRQFGGAATVVLALAAGAYPAEGPEYVGYGGPDGSRIYRDASPPLHFDMVTGEGIRWETPLPVWGHGSPVAVRGRVFVMCEVGPKNIFPLLVCLDGATGKVLWQREIDHLDAVTASKAEQDRLRREIRAWFDREAELILARARSEEEKRRAPDHDKDQNARLKALYEAMGLMHDKFRRGQYANGYSCIGDAFGTPLTDGRHVYAATPWGGFACYDFEGNRRWVAYGRGNRWTWCNIGRSPILHRGVLYSNNGGTMRAIDAASGRMLWTRDEPGKGFEPPYSMVSPAVITTGGRDVLLAAGPSAYLLPAGTPLKVEGWVSEGMQILVKHDARDVAFFCGSGEHCGWEGKGDAAIQPPAAFRFRLQGDTLRGDLLWHGGTLGGDKGVWGGNTPWMLCVGGRFYHRGGAILDALTGRVVGGKFTRSKWDKARGVPQTGHFLACAGGYVFGLQDGGEKDAPAAILRVYTLGGQRVAENRLVRRPPTLEQRQMHTYCTGNPEVWRSGQRPRFSCGHAFTFEGDRLYIRSLDALICVGPAKGAAKP